jgi:Domain of unknown function (DUF4382)
MRNRTPIALGLSLAGLCAVLVACSAGTDVSLTGNTPAQYSHVYITTQEVWFNNSATAGPDDGGWTKFTLSTPTTVDLVQENGGNLGSITTDLKLIAGSYSQIRLIPVDSQMALTSSAQGVGALYNAEADYVDSSGTTHQLPLELLNPDKGIAVAAQSSLKVPFGSVGAALSGSGLESGSTANTETGTTTGAETGTTTGLGIGSTTSTIGTSTSSTTSDNQFAINVIGNSDLVPFAYGASATAGIMLSSHASAYNLTQVAGITGQLTLTNLSGTTSISGLPAIQATAEQLSADGTRWVAVASTPVNADGTFLIYPLQSSTSSAVYYDVVIHGPGIATIIIQSVNVELLSCSSSGLSSLTSSTCNCSSSSLTSETSSTGTTCVTGSTSTAGTTSTTGTTDTTGTTSTTGTTGLASSSSDTTGTTTTSATATTTTGTSINVSAVSLGTLYPRAASYYTANLPTSPAESLPAGALIGFYETIGGANEVPHLIEASALDPFNQVLANPQALSAGTIDYGTWTSTNANVTVVSAAPVEGAGNYTVSATAPSFASGPLDPSTRTYRVSAPASCNSSTTSSNCTPTTPVTTPTLPALTLASGTTSGTVSVAVSEASPGKYNHGELLVSQNGQLVATASLDGVFASGSGGTVTVNNVPAETPTALYYLSVRAWNSADPTTTLHRQWYDTAVDLRSSASGKSDLTVN